MRNKGLFARTAVAGAFVSSVVAMAIAPTMASAQPYDDDYYSQEVAPPEGEYAEPPPDYQEGSAYDPRYREYDERYGDYASRWATDNCIRERQNNAVAGAVVGGVLGAVVGSNVAGRGNRTEGAIVGGALGATAGAAVGANSGSGVGCPPGYVVRAGAPGFVYAGPAYGTSMYYGPSWYRPWVYVGGRWNYRPYRYWYWNNRPYWKQNRRWKRRNRR